MKLLFIHQNFPGQFLHLVQHMRSTPGNEVIGVGETRNINRRGRIAGMVTVGYPSPQGAGAQTHHYLQSTEAGVRRGQAVARVLLQLRQGGFTPDVICVHPGWGEGIFVRDIFPQTPILMFAEFFFQKDQADLNFDPEFPSSTDWGFCVRIRNSVQSVSLPSANICVSPTMWQASRYPAYLRNHIQVLHEGIDTRYMRPDNNARLVIQRLKKAGESVVLPEKAQGPAPGAANETPENAQPQRAGSQKEDAGMQPEGSPLSFVRGDKVILFVARNLEPYRGFHVFMRSLPELQRRHPDAHVLIVGDDGVSYSPVLPDGETYKNKYLEELGDKLRLDRIHFLGRVPYVALQTIFRVASAHVYLTYPFVLSWSMLESMACEGLIIGSRTPPVEEVITHRKNGLLVDFFDQKTLVEHMSNALESPGDFTDIRAAARETVVSRYELQDCLAAQEEVLRKLAAGRYSSLE